MVCRLSDFKTVSGHPAEVIFANLNTSIWGRKGKASDQFCSFKEHSE